MGHRPRERRGERLAGNRLDRAGNFVESPSPDRLRPAGRGRAAWALRSQRHSRHSAPGVGSRVRRRWSAGRDQQRTSATAVTASSATRRSATCTTRPASSPGSSRTTSPTWHVAGENVRLLRHAGHRVRRRHDRWRPLRHVQRHASRARSLIQYLDEHQRPSRSGSSAAGPSRRARRSRSTCIRMRPRSDSPRSS